MHLLLADADKENLKNFRTYIKGAHAHIKVVGTFDDPAKDIIPVIRETKPDLILADIRFFGGMHFARFKDVQDQFPGVRFVVYGTYNEAEYMKRGREFGVLDFMYRPVKPSDLNRCLELATKHFKREAESRRRTQLMAKDYQDRIFQYEEIFLRSLLEGHMSKAREIQDGINYFNLPFGKTPETQKGYSVFIIRIDHYRRMALAMTENEKHLRVFEMLGVVKASIADYQARTFIYGFNEMPIILNGPFVTEEKVLLADKIKQALLSETDTRVTIGIGRTYDTPLECSVSFREADATFGYRFRMGYNAVIPIEFVEPHNHITYRYPSSRERRLVYAAVVGDFAYCRGILTELFDALGQAGTLPETLVAKTVMTIILRISRYISEQNLPFAAEVSRFFPTTSILKLVTVEDGFTFLEKSLEEFCAYIVAHNGKLSLQLHAAAKKHVQEIFYETFSVTRIAAKLGTTPENLNKVFMEREKVMLFDYVMWVRVNQAQKILRETATDEEIIAVQVGFDDVKYFRSIFRKYIGEMPAEYRMRERAKAPPQGE
ncbi:MAG: helix-turn-helix domain-containing protein [Defluviitaleaceae bacterium]|nr:helix-turn-helix domain-containing protein [Defluviitaleaceae bacterium]MCL2276227.1 helix-turn-helix domain-containing protein [Defluviitaleaceae bacterium]